MLKSILKKILIVVVIGLTAWILIGSYYIFWANYSDGYRIGTVIKLAKRGVVFKTYEGQLNLEFFPSGAKTSKKDDSQSNIWNFSVSNKSVAAEIETANDKGKRVKLYYDEKYYRLPWVGETKFVVNRVEELPSNQ